MLFSFLLNNLIACFLINIFIEQIFNHRIFSHLIMIQLFILIILIIRNFIWFLFYIINTFNRGTQFLTFIVSTFILSALFLIIFYFLFSLKNSIFPSFIFIFCLPQNRFLYYIEYEKWCRKSHDECVEPVRVQADWKTQRDNDILKKASFLELFFLVLQTYWLTYKARYVHYLYKSYVEALYTELTGIKTGTTISLYTHCQNYYYAIINRQILFKNNFKIIMHSIFTNQMRLLLIKFIRFPRIDYGTFYENERINLNKMEVAIFVKINYIACNDNTQSSFIHRFNIVNLSLFVLILIYSMLIALFILFVLKPCLRKLYIIFFAHIKTFFLNWYSLS